VNRTKKFFYNALTTATFQIFAMAAGFILPKVMLNLYGSEINGLVTSITQFISYLTLVEAGLSGATVYSLYKPLAEDNHLAINRILSAAKRFYYRTGFLFLGLILGGAFLYPLFIKSALLSYKEIFLLFIVLGTNGVLEFFTLAKYRALLTADQKTYVISLASIMQVVLNCVIIATLSYCGVSIVIVRAIAIVAILLRTVILWAYCKTKYKYLDFSVEPDNKAMDKRWDALYFQIIGVIHTGSPIIIATIVLSLNEVSIYSIYYMVINGVSAVLGIFTSGLSAGFGDLLVRGEKANFKKAFQQFEYFFYMIISIVYATMMVTYIPFIKVYTASADINYVYPIFALLVTINGFMYNLKTPYGMLTIAAGKYKESRIQITIQALIEVGLGVVFAFVWGLNGIIIGSLTSNIYRNIDFIFFAPKYLISYGFKDSLIMWCCSILLVAVSSLIVSFLPNTGISGYASWFIYAAVVFAVIFAFVVLVNYLIDKNRMKDCVNRLLSKLRR
jgi:hypothetical protein